MRGLGLVLCILFLLITTSSQAKDCGNCFEDTEPYVQVNYLPFINWGVEDINVCPGGDITYHEGEPLFISFGLWDKCEEYRGAPQKVCGEFFIVVTDEEQKHFLFFTEGSWHLTTRIEEIRPYRRIGETGSVPFVWHQYFPQGVELPRGIYYAIAFVDKVGDNKPTLSAKNFKYCLVRVTIP